MYRRFLNNKDYLSIITEEALSQLTRGHEFRFEQAEQAAEATIVDYLMENYEIEEELNKGKRTIGYNRKITYPVGVHFYFNDEIYEVIKAINGYKSPCPTPYWHESDECVDLDTVPFYSQMATYHPKDKVKFNDVLFECDLDNGYDFGNIRIPGIVAWEKAVVSDWEAVDKNLWDVVRYDNQYFTLMTKENYDPFVNPMASECWGLIGEYDPNIDTYELSDHEYVVYENEVYYPIINPNADQPELEVNIAPRDPRNYNLKRHMVQLALYELYKLISPYNMSTVRVDDYDHSIQWLKDASKLKLNPQIPRKISSKDKLPVTDWQMATFQVSYDPYNNPWHV